MHVRNVVYYPASQTHARYRVLYGGAGSGKSVAAAQDEIARLAADGRHRLLVLRKVLRTCRYSTFQLFRDVIAAMGRTHQVKVNEAAQTITFPSGARLQHGGLDDVEKLKSISGITRIWVEEATELTYNERREEHDFDQVDLRLRGVDPELVPQITLTFNPAKAARWIVKRFGLVPGAFPQARGHAERGDVFVQHTTWRDNPFVGEDYGRVFARLPEAMRTVYESGEFVQSDAPDQVIPMSAIKTARETPSDVAVEVGGGRGALGVDVARFGQDASTLARFRGYACLALDELPKGDTVATARYVGNAIAEHSIDPLLVGIDAVGLGAGTVDNLRASGYDATEVVSGAKPLETIVWPGQIAEATAFRFANLRSQMWWFAREAMTAGLVHLAPDVADDEDLVEDLLAPRYRIAAQKTIEVEPKQGASPKWSVRARLGRSTDKGDAFVYGLFVRWLAAERASAASLPAFGFGT